VDGQVSSSPRIRRQLILDLRCYCCCCPNLHSRQDGKTALHCSTSDDAYEVAEFLLDAGASVDAQDEVGSCVCSHGLQNIAPKCACTRGLAPCTAGHAWLIKNTISCCWQSGKTALHYCVQEGGLLVTDLLLSRGANIDLADADGNSPLTLALQRASLNVLQLFLNHHQLVATPQRHDFGADALLRAVEMRSEAIVRFIVENEYAHVTACNAKGETPMHRAILQHDPGMMEMLSDLDLEGGSLTATTAEKLETPAHYAARYGSHREVHTLLQCLTRAFGDLGELPELGAENPLDAVDANGKTSLFIAGTLPLSSGSGGIGRWALEVEAVAVAVGSLADRDEKVQLLLDHGARLFPAGVLATGLASSASIPDSPSQMVLPTHVQSCLRTWLAEDAVARVREPEGEEAVLQADGEVDSLEALAELCMAWIACVPRLGPSVTLLSIVTCAGYGHDVLPLLLDLPLRRRGFPALLHQLRKFARREPEHALLLQLQHELSAAWRELEELASATSVLQLA
jgi:ankyrin repeat protein